MHWFVGLLIASGIAAGAFLPWRLDPIRLLRRDFPAGETLCEHLYRCRVYLGGEMSTLTDVGANTSGIYLQPPSGVPRGWFHYLFSYGGAYVLKKAAFVPWDQLVYRRSRVPLQKKMVFKVPANGATFMIPQDIAERLFVDAAREFRDTPHP